MKRIIFLIIGTLLVLGLVLPGCGGGGGFVRTRPIVAGEINIAVTGPMGDVQGIHHMLGATMAEDEINLLPGKITINGTPHTVVLHQVQTNEIQGQPSEGVLALRAVIEDVDLVVGGFRTESVSAYRLEAMDDQVIFMNCGAATKALQESVISNYATYKYWFKATPYNEVFLVTSMLKMTAGAVATLVGTLKTYQGGGYTFDDPAYNFTGNGTQENPYVVKVAIFGEALSWAAGIVAVAQARLPGALNLTKNITMQIVGTWLVSDKAPSLTTEMAQIAATKPHVIFTIFSGPVGKVYSKARADSALPALSIGINVEAQLQSLVTYTADGCLYDMILDTWGYGVAQTNLTTPFLTKFMSPTYSNGEYPLYTAATYDAIYALRAAIQGTNSLEPDVMIAWLEDKANAQMGTGTPATAYYPMPATTLSPGLWALNSTQVLAFYPWLDGLTIWNGTAAVNWTYNPALWTSGLAGSGYVAHDTAYGPGYQTGIGNQWQNITGTLRKVGWWPNSAGSPGLANLTAQYIRTNLNGATSAALWQAGLLDQHGFWNFEYAGERPLVIPHWWWMNTPGP
ncbi:MAG: hypothetical protein A2Y59_06420 [Chloroflexi bacterium RBG_13_52_14]|nr:MAG: hypothetical protein A2Y59_06420 [Chloroflexi bacterium RBG_13_52_14]